MEITIKFNLESVKSFAEVTLNSESILEHEKYFAANTKIKLAIHHREILAAESISNSYEEIFTFVFNAMMCMDKFELIQADEIIDPTFTKVIDIEDLRALHNFIHTYVIKKVDTPHQPQQ